MSMTHRQRLETAWRFEEPDRVPIEIQIDPDVRTDPRAQRLVALMDEHADNFVGLPGADWGFMGLPTRYREEVIEDVPGEYRRVRRTHETPVGTFLAYTYHPAGTKDFRWDKRFICTPEDLDRLAGATREPAKWDRQAYRRADADLGERGCPMTGLWHPLGTLVRNATMEEVYAWFYEQRGLMHRFLAAGSEQIAATVERMGGGLCFVIYAHEMLIPPWMGHRLFDEFVVPYDRRVNDAIHAAGSRLRCHCHGNCMDFLTSLADLGTDSIEPLEGPPAGDVDLAQAKRRVGERMMLSGNIASQHFVHLEPAEVRRQVREAITAAGVGGGFTLRTTGGHAGTQLGMPDDVLERVLANCEAYLQAGLEFGQYPIRA